MGHAQPNAGNSPAKAPVPPLTVKTHGLRLPFDFAQFAPRLETRQGEPFVSEKAARLIKGDGTILWKLPADLPAGSYALEWTGVAPDAPAEWTEDREPYIVRIGAGEKTLAPAAFSYEVAPSRRRAVPEFKHSLLDVPLSVTTRRSDRPLRLAPGQMLSLESRSGGFALTGEPQLVPLDDAHAVDMEISSAAPFNIFDAIPPRFAVKVTAPGAQAFAGQVRVKWLDALTGKTEAQTLPVQSGATLQLEWKPPFGVYTLTVELFNGEQTLLKQQRHFSYAPLVSNANLPDDWPFAWHLRGEPYVPPVGFKWQRLFTSWEDMEPKQGQYDWAVMDRLYQQAKANNFKLLWVCGSIPRWASSRPDLPRWPEKPYRGVYRSKPPRDWQLLRDFLRAFYARYAPNGDASVLGAIEVLNEPNAHGPDIEFSFAEYAEMCKVVHEETRKVSPAIKVVGISESGGLHMWWVNGVLDAGAGQYMDVASAHGYETATPLGVVSIQSKFQLLREALDKRGLRHVGIWDTETGIGVWGRRGERIQPDAAMDWRARHSPLFDPKSPGKVGTRWRSVNEWVGSANMVRSSAQKIELNATPVFYFKWDAGNLSWVGDRAPEGNPIPKMMIPVQAVQSELWKRYATRRGEPLKIISPDPRFVVFAHRFAGPQGRLTVLYTYPKSGGFVITDETAAKAAGATVGEPIISADEGKFIANLPSYDTKLFDVMLPGLRPGAVAMDLLAREQKPLGAGDVKMGVAQTPIYIIEPQNGGAVWPKAP